MRRVQVKPVISHCDCNCKLKKNIVTESATGSHSLVVVTLKLQSFFACIWNHSFNLDLLYILFAFL